LQARPTSVLHELVRNVEAGRVTRDAHLCSHAEAINRGARAHQSRNLIFIEATACEDSHALKPRLVEDAPCLDGEIAEVARIETHGTDTKARPELARKIDHLANTRQGVVRVDQ